MKYERITITRGEPATSETHYGFKVKDIRALEEAQGFASLLQTVSNIVYNDLKGWSRPVRPLWNILHHVCNLADNTVVYLSWHISNKEPEDNTHEDDGNINIETKYFIQPEDTFVSTVLPIND